MNCNCNCESIDDKYSTRNPYSYNSMLPVLQDKWDPNLCPGANKGVGKINCQQICASEMVKCVDHNNNHPSTSYCDDICDVPEPVPSGKGEMSGDQAFNMCVDKSHNQDKMCESNILACANPLCKGNPDCLYDVEANVQHYCVHSNVEPNPHKAGDEEISGDDVIKMCASNTQPRTNLCESELIACANTLCKDLNCIDYVTDNAQNYCANPNDYHRPQPPSKGGDSAPIESLINSTTGKVILGFGSVILLLLIIFFVMNTRKKIRS